MRIQIAAAAALLFFSFTLAAFGSATETHGMAVWFGVVSMFIGIMSFLMAIWAFVEWDDEP
jgi:hypothetical protein